MELTAIRIKVRRGSDQGRLIAIYPLLDKIPESVRCGLGWGTYCQVYGIGLHVDHVNTIGDGNDHEYIYTAVPQAFVDEAVRLYPELVEVISGQSLNDALETVCHGAEPDNIYDHQLIQTLYHLTQLEAAGVADPPTEKEIAKRKRMLNPDDATSGVIKNKNKDLVSLLGARTLKSDDTIR